MKQRFMCAWNSQQTQCHVWGGENTHDVSEHERDSLEVTA